jgi:hypothetical protein
MKHIIATLLIAAFTTVSFAQGSDDRVIVASPDDCPAGTAATVPSYVWQDGGFTRRGWVCEGIYSDR